MILGLDISTTMVGVAIINDSGKLVKSDAWDILKSETLFNKAEFIGAEIYGIRSEYDITHVFVEIESVIDKEKNAFSYEMARGGKNYKRGTDDKADAIVIARAGEFILRNKDNEGFLTEKIILVD